jgi:S1-C subfamily serine protease
LKYSRFIGKLSKYVPSPFGRGVGGEGLLDADKQNITLSRSSALTLALSQRERGCAYVICHLSLIAAMLILAPAARAGLPETIAKTQPKIVKIFGAGGFRGMENYQSGMLISPDGHILTAFSYVLDTDYITVILDDGRSFDAKLLGADPRLEIAVLKINATDLPYFDLHQAVKLRPSARVLAFSNLFGVAYGEEAASVQRGTVAAIARLEGRRGVFDTPYRGPVYVLDVTTNNPGAAGGALVSADGQLAGILGKELRNSLNNTWLNYALPIEELAQSVDEIRAGKFVARRESPAEKPQTPLDTAALGITLVPDVLERTPPFVDRLRPGSPAARAGIRPDDLIIMVGPRLVQSCKSLSAELDAIDRIDAVKLTVMRGQELLEFTLRADDSSTPLKGQP